MAGCKRDNLETMLMHPDADDALLVDPVQREVTRGHWETLFVKLSPRLQKRARGRLWRGKSISLGHPAAAQILVERLPPS